MKILENISSGYKRIATGIAIVAFLSMLYLAMIPGASVAYIYGPAGGVISGAFVFIKEWPQYNDTTATDGSYAIEQMPIGEYTFVVAGNDSVAPYIAPINVTVGNNNLPDITLSPAIKYYVPFLYQREDHLGFDYDSALQIQNGGTENATVEIAFYNPSDGMIAGNDFLKIKPNELLIKRPFELMTPRSIYYGPMFVKSDSTVQVQGYIKTISQDVYSLGPSFTSASTTAYVPYVYQRTDHIGFDYDGGFQVFNPGDLSTNVDIKLYYINGTLAGNRTFLVGPRSESLSKITDILPGVIMFYGAAEITSQQPIVAQSYIRTTATNIYSIAPSLNSKVTTAYIPFNYHRTDHIGFDYDGGFQIFNPGDVSTNVDIKLYYMNGTLAGNRTYLVGPKADSLSKIPDIIPGQTIYFGAAEITSEQPIVAQGYIRTTATNVYSVAPQVTKPGSPIDIHIPLLYSTKNVTHDGGIQVMNANNLQANINITLYYSNGTFAGRQSKVLNPNEQAGPKVFDIAPNSIDFMGYAIVSSDIPVVAQGFIRTKASNIYSIAPPVER